MFDEKMEKVLNKVKGDFAKSKEARREGIKSVQLLLKGITDLCYKNTDKIAENPARYLRIEALQFADMLINLASAAETASVILDMILEGYEESEKRQEAKEPETKTIGGYEKRPKCFGCYYENCKQCDYVLCAVRSACRDHYMKSKE